MFKLSFKQPVLSNINTADHHKAEACFKQKSKNAIIKNSSKRQQALTRMGITSILATVFAPRSTFISPFVSNNYFP